MGNERLQHMTIVGAVMAATGRSFDLNIPPPRYG